MTVDSAAALPPAVSFDLSDWTELELTGPDRAKFLHNFCTNDIKALPTGRGCQAFVANVQGKLLAHLFVYAGQETLHLFAAPGLSEKLIKHLSRYQINEEVAFQDATAAHRRLFVAGPKAPQALAALGIAVATLPESGLISGPPETGILQIFRNDFLRLPGYLVAGALASIEAFAGELAEVGVVPAGRDMFEGLRITAGFPLFGVDITDANLAQEANLTAEAISFRKGCYLGQEPIARIDALGHVNQQIRVLHLSLGPVPTAGTEVLADSPEGPSIGRITSAALHPSGHEIVALALMKRHHDTAGLSVKVAGPNGCLIGQVYGPA
ncbi:MAG: folate-binding protein YgfZ [Planctomycetes bacterium]|nr:folate-binding protein YgfZ [Planctomycetota bacterium]